MRYCTIQTATPATRHFAVPPGGLLIRGPIIPFSPRAISRISPTDHRVTDTIRPLAGQRSPFIHTMNCRDENGGRTSKTFRLFVLQ